MNQKLSHIEFEDAHAEIFCFDNGHAIKEYHALIHVKTPRMPFAGQLDAILNAYGQLMDGPLKGASAVFKRYFLSDAANQADDILLADKTVALRTQGVGILTTEDALRIGAVGPHARASNVPVDVRKDAPYSSYEDFDFDIAVWPSCDVFSRVVIRVLENFESIKIIRQALANLPDNKINLGTKIPKVKAGEYMMRYEAPRGQLCYKVVSDGGETNKRVSIHVPTFKNAPTVPTMLKGNSVADAGLIIASIDPCFSCMDR